MRPALRLGLGIALAIGWGTLASAATWANRFDFAGNGPAIDRVPSGGFVTAAVNRTSPGIIVIRLDADGNAVWQSSLLRTPATAGQCEPIVRSSADGGFCLAGCATPLGDTSNVVLAKLDAAGVIVWQRSFSAGAASAFSQDVVGLADGGCLLAGSLGLADTNKSWVLRADASGATVWSQTLDTPGIELDFRATEAANGDLLFASGTLRSGWNPSGLVIRLGPDGSVRWLRAVDGPAGVDFTAIAVTAAGEILVAGEIGNHGQGGGKSGALLVRLDAQGTLLGSRTYRGPYRFEAIAADSSGRIALAGQTFEAGQLADGLFVVADATGAPIALSTHGGSGMDGLSSVVVDGEGGYAASGVGAESELGTPSLLVERVDASGLIGAGCPWSVPRAADVDTRPVTVRSTSLVIAPFAPSASTLSLSNVAGAAARRLVCFAP